MPDAAARGDLAGSISTLVGVPMNTGVTNRKGARFGPSALRKIERVGLYAHGTWFSPMAKAKIADIGDVTMQSLHDPGRRHQNIEACYHRLVAAGVRRPVVGGDHSISSSLVKAVGAKQPTGFIHIAEYLYTAGPYEDAKFQHGGQFRLAVLDAMIDPKRAIHCGMTVVHAEDVRDGTIGKIFSQARAHVGNGATYISFDMGPGFAHGTCLAEINIASGDVVEVTLRHDRSINAARIAPRSRTRSCARWWHHARRQNIHFAPHY